MLIEPLFLQVLALEKRLSSPVARLMVPAALLVSVAVLIELSIGELDDYIVVG